MKFLELKNRSEVRSFEVVALLILFIIISFSLISGVRSYFLIEQKVFQLSSAQSDNKIFNVSQNDVEFQKFIRALEAIKLKQERTQDDFKEARLRYDILYSRIKLLASNSETAKLLASGNIQEDAVEIFKEYDDLFPLIGETNDDLLKNLDEIYRRALILGGKIRSLTLETLSVAQKNADFSKRSLISLLENALIVLLTLLVLTAVMAGWAIKNLWSVRKLASNVEDKNNDLKAVLASSNDAILFCESDGRIKTANEVAGNLIGDTKNNNSLYFDDVFTFYSADEVEVKFFTGEGAVALSVEGYYELGGPIYLAKENQRLPISASVLREVGWKRNTEAFIIHLQDKSQLESTENRLKSIEDRSRLILRATSDSFWDWNVSDGLLLTGENFDEVADSIYDPKTLLKFLFPELRNDSNVDQLVERFTHALETNKSEWRSEVSFMDSRMGRIASYFLSAHVLHDEDGLHRVVGSITDITTQREMEKKREHRERLAEIGRMTGTIGHDLNNMLNVIFACLEILRSNKTEAEKSEAIFQIERSIDTGAKLTASLLNFSRSGKGDPEPLSVNDFLINIEPILQSSIGSKQTLSLNLMSKDALINVDKARLSSSLLNLVVNSSHAISDFGKINVSSSLLSDHCQDSKRIIQSQGIIRLTVSDNGSGMSQAVLDNATSPFFTTKNETEGTGLGLSSVKEFVEQSGGELDIRSKEGVGTDVNIDFPITKIIKNDISEGSRRITKASKNFTPKSVVVVDDDEANRDLMKARLEELGCEVWAYDPGVVQEKQLELGNFDCAIFDYELKSQYNGIDYAHEFQKFNPNIIIIIISGRSLPVSSFGDLKNYKFLQKPVQTRELKNAFISLGENRSRRNL